MVLGQTGWISQTIQAPRQARKRIDMKLIYPAIFTPCLEKEGYKFKGWFVNNILIDETFHSRVDVTAVAKWEKIEIPVDVTPVDNPTTGDNILKHVMLLVISLIGLGISTVKFKLKLKTKKVL